MIPSDDLLNNIISFVSGGVLVAALLLVSETTIETAPGGKRYVEIPGEEPQWLCEP